MRVLNHGASEKKRERLVLSALLQHTAGDIGQALLSRTSDLSGSLEMANCTGSQRDRRKMSVGGHEGSGELRWKLHEMFAPFTQRIGRGLRSITVTQNGKTQQSSNMLRLWSFLS